MNFYSIFSMLAKIVNILYLCTISSQIWRKKYFRKNLRKNGKNFEFLFSIFPNFFPYKSSTDIRTSGQTDLGIYYIGRSYRFSFSMKKLVKTPKINNLLIPREKLVKTPIINNIWLSEKIWNWGHAANE